MSDFVTFDLELQMDVCSDLLDPDGYVVNDPDGEAIQVLGGWVNVLGDTRGSVPIEFSRGNQGNDIVDRVGDEGVLTCGMDNSEHNSAGLAGYYSPDHINLRATFGQDVATRLKITYDGTDYYDWQGKVNSILPLSGIAGERVSYVTCLDYMHELYKADFQDIAVQTNKRDDELLALITAKAEVEPEETDYDTGGYEYPYAFHDQKLGTSKLINAVQRLMMSGLGKVFVRGSTTSGEVLTYINLSNIINASTPVAALYDNMTGLDVVRDDTNKIKSVYVTTHPVEVDGSPVVLWQLNSEISIAAGESKTFLMSLRDPNGRATHVSALSLEDPVADTDYKFSSVSGSGNDLNGSVSFEFSEGTYSYEVTVTNNAAVTGYLWFFKPRGTGVYLYEPTTTKEETGQGSGKSLTVDMFYQDDPNVGTDVTAIVKNWYEENNSNVRTARFIANTSEELMLAALTVQCGDYVTIYETLTGINSGFVVNGTKKKIVNGNFLYVEWTLCNAQTISNMFVLDVDALDSSGILGV